MELLKVYMDKKGSCLTWIPKSVAKALGLKKGDYLKVEHIDERKKQITLIKLEG